MSPHNNTQQQNILRVQLLRWIIAHFKVCLIIFLSYISQKACKKHTNMGSQPKNPSASSWNNFSDVFPRNAWAPKWAASMPFLFGRSCIWPANEKIFVPLCKASSLSPVWQIPFWGAGRPLSLGSQSGEQVLKVSFLHFCRANCIMFFFLTSPNIPFSIVNRWLQKLSPRRRPTDNRMSHQVELNRQLSFPFFCSFLSQCENFQYAFHSRLNAPMKLTEQKFAVSQSKGQ